MNIGNCKNACITILYLYNVNCAKPFWKIPNRYATQASGVTGSTTKCKCKIWHIFQLVATGIYNILRPSIRNVLVLFTISVENSHKNWNFQHFGHRVNSQIFSLCIGFYNYPNFCGTFRCSFAYLWRKLFNILHSGVIFDNIDQNTVIVVYVEEIPSFSVQTKFCDTPSVNH